MQLNFPDSSTRSGADFAALRQRRDAVSGAEGQRFDGHRGLAASRGHQAAAIAKEKVLDVMCAVVRIDHRRLRIVPHPAGPEKVDAELLFPHRKTPLFLRARGVKKLVCALEHPIPELQIVRMILIRQAQRWQAPCILQIRVKREAVVLHRQRRAVAENLHRAVEVLRQRSFEILSPADRKSTRLNSSHITISYAVFCLKKKTLCDDGLRFALSDRL